MKELYTKLTMELAVSAREYFMILRLAIYHIDGEFLETSAEVAQHKSSEEVYKCAVKILLALR